MLKEYSQKYTVVCFFAAQNAANNFSASDWPLHVTILDTFKTDWPLNKLTGELEELASTIAAFDVTPTESAMLGPEKNVPVKLLLLNKDLLTLHNKLLELSDKGSFVYNTPEFVGPGFLPHATDQKNGSVKIGQKYHLDSISLVDMFPGGDHTLRAIVDTFGLRVR